MPYAVANSLLEKIGAKGILGIGINDALKGVGKKAVAKAVGKGAVKEGVTEGIQEPLQYTGETIGTIKGFKIDEAIQRSLQGIVVGTGFGGSIRTGTAIAESQTKSRQARERADGFRELNATESALRDTDPEAWADFQSSIMEDSGVDGVRLSEEGAELLMSEVQDRLASVEEDTALFVEIEQSIMQTGGALTADPAAARAGAQQMAAVFTTMAKRTGMPLQKIKDRFLPRIDRLAAEDMDPLEQSAEEFGVSAEVLKAELDAVGGDITQTPRFKEWFKQGKLLDAEGKPLALFHRTGADIEAFVPGGPNLPDNYRGDDFGLSGRAVFLSTDPAAPEANFRIDGQGERTSSRFIAAYRTPSITTPPHPSLLKMCTLKETPPPESFLA